MASTTSCTSSAQSTTSNRRRRLQLSVHRTDEVSSGPAKGLGEGLLETNDYSLLKPGYTIYRYTVIISDVSLLCAKVSENSQYIYQSQPIMQTGYSCAPSQQCSNLGTGGPCIFPASGVSSSILFGAQTVKSLTLVFSRTFSNLDLNWFVTSTIRSTGLQNSHLILRIPGMSSNVDISSKSSSFHGIYLSGIQQSDTLITRCTLIGESGVIDRLASILNFEGLRSRGWFEEEVDSNVVYLPTGSYYLNPRFVPALYADEIFALLSLRVISEWKWETCHLTDLWYNNMDVVGLCLATNSKEGFTDVNNRVRSLLIVTLSDTLRSFRFHKVLPSHPT